MGKTFITSETGTTPKFAYDSAQTDRCRGEWESMTKLHRAAEVTFCKHGCPSFSLVNMARVTLYSIAEAPSSFSVSACWLWLSALLHISYQIKFWLSWWLANYGGAMYFCLAERQGKAPQAFNKRTYGLGYFISNSCTWATHSTQCFEWI